MSKLLRSETVASEKHVLFYLTGGPFESRCVLVHSQSSLNQLTSDRVHTPNPYARLIVDHENGLEEMFITGESYIHHSRGIGRQTKEGSTRTK